MRRLLVTYVAAVAFAATVLAAVVLLRYPLQFSGFTPWDGVLVLMLLTIAAEGLGVRIAAGQAVFSVSLIPIVATVPLFGPSVAIASTALCQTVARTLLQRQPPLKAVFNVAQFTIAIGFGALVYDALGGPILFGSSVYASGVYSAVHTEFPRLDKLVIPVVGLIVTYFIANVFLVSSVIAIDSGKRMRDIWFQLGPVALANDFASSSFSLFVVFAFFELNVGGLVVVLLPLIFVHHAYGTQHKLAKQNKEILEFTIRTIEAKDPYTSGHSLRVAALSRELAEAVGLSAQKVEEVETAALLHDVGKIDFAYAELINSPAKLTDDEREVIRSHPERGARLLASLSSMSKNVLAAVRHHHEHYDGSGYPDGLVGEDIPLPARIIMIVDTVDAMLSNRPYRPALSVDQVAAELRRFSGRQFDPALVSTFLERGMLQRAARKAELDRTPLPLVNLRTPEARVSASS